MENIENKIKTSEETKPIEEKHLLENLNEDLARRNLTRGNLLQGGGIIEVNVDQDIYGAINNRPFLVSEVKSSQTGEEFVYKGEIKNLGPFQSIKKEEIIYSDILPEIYESFPEDIKEKFISPKLVEGIKKDAQIEAIILEKINGEICGNHNATKENIWNTKDIKDICFLIKKFQEINPDKIRSKGFPELPFRDFLKHYEETTFQQLQDPIREMFGQEGVEKMTTLLKKAEQVIPNQPEILLSEDIFCFNTIKTPDGKFAFIDWERPYTGKDASADYGKLISRLWTNPGLQEEAIKDAIELNSENNDFKTLLRISLLLLEGGHMFKHYFNKLEESDPQEKEEAKKAIKVFKELIGNILNGTGIWKE